MDKRARNQLADSMAKPHALSRYIRAGLIALPLLVGYILLGLFSNRGIDLTDESFYVLGYISNLHSVAFPSSFFDLYRGLLGWLELDLAGMRWVRVISTALSCWALSAGVRAHTKDRLPPSSYPYLYGLVFAGGLATYSWGPTAISYNSFTFVFLALTTSAWLMRGQTTSPTKRFFWEVATGASIACLFMARIPSGILMLITLGGFISATLYKRPFSITRTVWIVPGFTLGILLITLLVFGNPENLTIELKRLIGLASNPNENNPNHGKPLPILYLRDMVRVIQNVWLPCVLVGGSLIIAGKRRLATSLADWIPLIMLAAIFVLFQSWQGGTAHKHRLIEIYAVMLVYAITVHFSQDAPRLRNWALILWLACLPLAGAIGTSNILSGQLMFYMPFLTGALFLLLADSPQRQILPAVTGLVILTAFTQGTVSSLLHPYRASENVFLQRNPLPVKGVFHGHKVSDQDLSLYQQLAEFAEQDIEYLFTFRHQTGLHLLLDKKALSADWMNENCVGRLCNIIRKAPPIDPGNLLFIIPDTITLDEQVVACLADKGIYFPRDYHIVKQAQYARATGGPPVTLQVYLHRNSSN